MPISGKLALDDAHVPAKAMSTASVLRWLAIFVFVLSTALNYLDRLLLAAVAPTVKAEFHLSNVQYGQIISAFSIVYAVMAPAAGWLIDRAGLSLSMTLAMSVWSMAGIFTGITRSFSGLFVSRTVLGIGEAACIPAFGKVNGLYLAPRELAFGTAVNQVGIALGSIAAPLLVAAMAPVWGWRSVFVISGALGFVWIPLWWFTSRRISPPQTAQKREPDSDQIGRVLRDRRIWALMVANALVMTLYTLWTNWTTVFFVDRYGLSEAVANRQFAWVPTVFATLGGFCGGWMTYRAIREGTGEFSARMRTCWVGHCRSGDQPRPGHAHASIGCRGDQLQLLLVPGDFDESLCHAYRIFWRRTGRVWRVDAHLLLWPDANGAVASHRISGRPLWIYAGVLEHVTASVGGYCDSSNCGTAGSGY